MRSLVRRQKILALPEQHGVMSVGGPARPLRASEMAVRRDLAVLCPGVRVMVAGKAGR